MKKWILFIILVLSFWLKPIMVQSQQLDYKTYHWEEKPALSTTDLDTSNSSIVVFVKYLYEFAFEKNELKEFKLTHKRIKLITDLGVEYNNKVYIPLYNDDKSVMEKARVIKKNGTVVELKPEEIKEGYDQESGTKYHYFAFEGVEVGCEIEYMYCIMQNPAVSGSLYAIQSNLPILYSESKFITPSNLIFKFKSFNGCPDVEKDTLETERNVWVIKKSDIPRLRDEEAGAVKANVMKFAFKLDKNTYNGKKDIYSYGPIASETFERVYNHIESKDLKAIKNLIQDIKIKGENEETKIRMVENFLKANFIFHESTELDKSNISKVIANKAYNETGAIVLYANLFKSLDIESEIVLTCNRFEKKFDKEFECYTFLDKYLIYFPKIKKFLAPDDNFSRLGFPDNSYVNTYGLFIKTISMGDYTTGLGKIKFIAGARHEESMDILKIKADITSDFSDTKLNIIREMTGYQAALYQPYFGFIKEEDKLKEFSESLIKNIDKEGTIEELTFENNSGNFLGQKPFITKSKLKSDYFFEKAGNKYLFKVGMMIGPQLELYKKEERKLPLQFPFTHGYIRTIEFNIPDGFKISNLESINLSELYVRENQDTTMGFISNYKVENKKVVISISEYYKEYDYKVSEFEEYRRVANAAANFNKVVLVFEKQQ